MAKTVTVSFNETVGLGGIDASTLDMQCEGDFNECTDNVYMQMQTACCLGLQQITLFSGSRNSSAQDFFVAALLRLTVLAEKLGIDVLVSNRRGSCLEQLDDLAEVLARVGAQNLYVDIDVVELHLACVNPCDALLAFGSRVARMRLSNVDGGLQAALADGEIQVAAVLRAMQKVNCCCPVVLTLGDDECAETRLSADVRFLEAAGHLSA